jgi:hypothetical protein
VQFLVGGDSAGRLAKVDGQIVRLLSRDYYRYRIGAFSELIARHAGPAVSLLELAASFGYNLFTLSRGSRWQRLRGRGISPNGIAAGRQIATQFRLSSISSPLFTCSTCPSHVTLPATFYIRSMDSQTRLFKLLDALDVQGRIRVVSRERIGSAPTLHNDGLLYAWEPR